jgi:hypothetical protein
VRMEKRFEVWQRRGGGTGKQHIAVQRSPDALCGRDIDTKAHSRTAELSEIEAILRVRRYASEPLCKSCVRAAQRHRSPLDRMASISG